MNLIAAITWNVSPEIFSWEITPSFTLEVRWYGLLFATSFIVGQYILSKVFKQENRLVEDVDSIVLYMVAGVILGARLGHCLFYDPVYYLSNPMEILMVWKGGLASHGAAIGIFSSIWLYSKKHADQSYLWLLDRIALTVAMAGFFIRFGNLMNSEIVGKATNVPWGFTFVRLGEDFARHPAQLYESLSYLAIFFFLNFTYNKTKENTAQGKIFGLFMILIFGFRFLYEFLKKNQEAFEEGMWLNMGQILSVPLVLVGIYVFLNSKKLGALPMPEPIVATPKEIPQKKTTLKNKPTTKRKR